MKSLIYSVSVISRKGCDRISWIDFLVVGMVLMIKVVVVFVVLGWILLISVISLVWCVGCKVMNCVDLGRKMCSMIVIIIGMILFMIRIEC